MNKQNNENIYEDLVDLEELAKELQSQSRSAQFDICLIIKGYLIGRATAGIEKAG